MKAVIFCGGQGLRLRRGASDPPKPLTSLGGQPLLWHLVRYFSAFGCREAVLCLGHYGAAIRAWAEAVGALDGCRLHPVDTGLGATIGDRLRAVAPLLEDEPVFWATYADGLCDADLDGHLSTFRGSDALASFLAVRPRHLTLDAVDLDGGGRIAHVGPLAERVWVNGGFFCLRPGVFSRLRPGEELVREGFGRLRQEGLLSCRRHTGFWGCIDTPGDLARMEAAYAAGAPWAVWERRRAAVERGL